MESFDGMHEKRGSTSGAVRSMRNFGAAARRPLARILNSKARSLVWAGAELGMLAFFANAIMVGRHPFCHDKYVIVDSCILLQD